jgi:hypothetical protein
MDAPLVQKRSVAAAEIDQPKFADILQMDERVPARHFGRFQHDRVSGSPPERTTAVDWVACAIGFFQPGTFLWRGVHEETLYQEVMIEATCVKSRGARADWHKPDMGCRRRSFSF